MLHIFISNTPDELKPGSSGKPVPGYEARILDEDEQPVEEPGEAGYLSVKGDSAAAYYWRNHEKTKETMKGEWIFAGDWYRVDEDGYYWYEGRDRKSTRLNSSHANISYAVFCLKKKTND